MKITLFPPALILCVSLLMVSCSEEETGVLQAEDLKLANLEVFDTKDLEGVWNLYSMHSDVAIDLNGDKTSSKDILSETDCFKPMYYEFDSSGNVTASQAKLHFDQVGITSCDGGIYTSPYTLNGDMLEITFHDKNGTAVTTQKKIKLTDNKQLLHISIRRLEASAYIRNDSGNSTAVIDSIAMIYKKYIPAAAP